MPPEIAPTVQTKPDGVLEVNEIFVVAPLQIVAVFAVMTIGVGLTVTVIIVGVPTQEPVVAVGVTIYSTVPEVVPLGLVNT